MRHRVCAWQFAVFVAGVRGHKRCTMVPTPRVVNMYANVLGAGTSEHTTKTPSSTYQKPAMRVAALRPLVPRPGGGGAQPRCTPYQQGGYETARPSLLHGSAGASVAQILYTFADADVSVLEPDDRAGRRVSTNSAPAMHARGGACGVGGR